MALFLPCAAAVHSIAATDAVGYAATEAGLVVVPVPVFQNTPVPGA